MSTVRPGTPGATRACPHCKATILESASVCPACRGHLRYDEASVLREKTKVVPLRIEGTLVPPAGDAFEYAMVLSIRNERGEEVNRQVVGVGALEGSQSRTFSVTVETNVVPAGKGRRR